MDVMTSYYQQHPMMGAQMGGGYAYPYAQQPYANYYNSGFQPMVYNNNSGIPQVAVNMESTLKPEEEQILNSVSGGDVMSLQISPEKACIGICNHHGKLKNGEPVRVLEVGDGTGDVICTRCKHRWNPNRTYEEVAEGTKIVSDAMNTIKIINPMPTEIARQYYSIIPILEMTPEIFKYTVNRFTNGFNQNYLVNSDDLRAMSELAAICPSEMYGAYDQYNAGFNPYQMQMMQQPMMPAGAVAQPNVNPMQVTYGINPAAPNQQFVQQAQAMMPGQPYQMVQSGYNYAAPGQAQPSMPVSNPYFAPAQQQQGAAVTTDNKDGSETSSQVLTI